MPYEIKALSLGGILDYSVRLLKDHFLFVFGVICVFIVPFQLPLQFAIAVLEPAGGAFDPTRPEDVELSASDLTYFLLTLAVVPIAMVLSLVSQGAATYGIAQRYLGNNVTVKEALTYAFSRIFGLLWLSILSSVLIGLGMMFCLLPGVYLALAWFVMVPVLIFERLSAIASLGRSRELMKGQMGKAFVLIFIMGIINFAIGFGALLIPNAYVVAVMNTLGYAATTAVYAAVSTVFYFSARCANENFDLELLTSALESPQGAMEPEL